MPSVPFHRSQVEEVKTPKTFDFKKYGQKLFAVLTMWIIYRSAKANYVSVHLFLLLF